MGREGGRNVYAAAAALTTATVGMGVGAEEVVAVAEWQGVGVCEDGVITEIVVDADTE